MASMMMWACVRNFIKKSTNFNMINDFEKKKLCHILSSRYSGPFFVDGGTAFLSQLLI
jgi:hypothetical protein